VLGPRLVVLRVGPFDLLGVVILEDVQQDRDIRLLDDLRGGRQSIAAAQVLGGILDPALELLQADLFQPLVTVELLDHEAVRIRRWHVEGSGYLPDGGELVPDPDPVDQGVVVPVILAAQELEDRTAVSRLYFTAAFVNALLWTRSWYSSGPVTSSSSNRFLPGLK